MSCQHRPESLLLGASTPLLEREDTHDKVTCVSSVSKTEDMRKWGGKSTSPLAVWVCEVNVRKNNHDRKFFKDKCHSSGRSSDKRADVTSDPLEGTSSSYLQGVSNENYDQD